ncbi:MAG: glycosyltransferase, partial [Alistipes sp.]|nr:glycosyltransferase [Alistipes sp.]
MSPLVSVVVTTYNHEPYLTRALDAILQQECDFGVEIVLGEDCSSDGTLAICREYAERYPEQITLITSTENVGWRANYRRCVEAARGKYVAFCDGDDYWC